MERNLFRSRSRVLSALLAAWIMAFAVAEAAHTHALVSPDTGQLSVGQKPSGMSQKGVCLACLAAHHPAPTAAVTVVFGPPLAVAGSPLVCGEKFLCFDAVPILPSRAPPTPSTQQA